MRVWELKVANAESIFLISIHVLKLVGNTLIVSYLQIYIRLKSFMFFFFEKWIIKWNEVRNNLALAYAFFSLFPFTLFNLLPLVLLHWLVECTRCMFSTILCGVITILLSLSVIFHWTKRGNSRCRSFHWECHLFQVQLANNNQLVDHYGSKHPKEKPPNDSGWFRASKSEESWHACGFTLCCPSTELIGSICRVVFPKKACLGTHVRKACAVVQKCS